MLFSLCLMMIGLLNLPSALNRFLRIGESVLSTAPPSSQGCALRVQMTLFYVRDIAYLMVWVIFVFSPWLKQVRIAGVLSISALCVVFGFAAGILARIMRPNFEPSALSRRTHMWYVLNADWVPPFVNHSMTSDSESDRADMPKPEQGSPDDNHTSQRNPSPSLLAHDELVKLGKWIDNVGWGAVRHRKSMLLNIGVFYKQQSMVASYSQEAMMQHTTPERVMYEIGSVTKVFTTALLADMVGRGEVDLHEPISNILGVATGRRWPEITLYQLATHTAGLPRFDMSYLLVRQWLFGNTNPYRHYSRDRLLKYVQRKRNLPSSSKGRYSNIGMDLLSHALAVRLGKSFEECLVNRICAPLGLSDTRITPTADQRVRLVNGHREDGRLASNWDTQLGGAGGLMSNVENLLKFLCANLGHGPASLVQVLRSCHHPRVPMANGRHRIGLGWMVSEDGSVWHNGMTGGYASFIGFHPEHHVGVVVLSNYAVSVDGIAVSILRRMVGR